MEKATTPILAAKKFISFVTFVALIICILYPIALHSQAVGGSLSGTITDESHGAVAGATISIANTATGVNTTVTTNAEGIYNAPNLLPGNYQVTVSAPGFQKSIQNGVVLTVGAQQVLNFGLKVGSVSQTVEVTTEAPDVQLSSSTINGSVSSNTIEEMPLNGRSWTDLATLQPGVSSIHDIAQATTHDRLGRGLGNQMTIDGGRPQQNNYLLNGVSINDYSNQAPGSILGENLGADAVSEFTILTSNYSTEYGRSSGGVISAITRSGTNQFHGSAYEYLRNSAMDAANFFDNATGSPKPEFRRNQFGVSGGGPIRKDKTFIFGDYEGLRETTGLSTVNTVPSRAARGIAPGATSTTPTQPAVVSINGTETTLPTTKGPGSAFNPDPVSGIDQSVQAYLEAFYPLPNVPGSEVGDYGIFSPAQSQVNSINYFTTRVDHKFSDSDSLAGTYAYDKAPFIQPDAFNNYVESNVTKRQIVTAEWNHVFNPTLVNTLRFGWSHIYAASPGTSKAINPAAADTSGKYSTIPGDTAGGVLDNTGTLTTVTGGLSSATAAFFQWNSYQVYDNVYLTKGIHSLKFGFNVERIQQLESDCGNCGGNFTFGSLGDFLLNNAPLNIVADTAPSAKYMRDTLVGAFVQDDIRLRPNLTVNAGLRYEMGTMPNEIYGHISAIHSIDGSQIYCGTASPTPTATCNIQNPVTANPSKLDFEPRVGFSWDPFKNGKTAIRGGFGMFDVQIFPVNLRGAPGAYPFSSSLDSSNLMPGDFPVPANLSPQGLSSQNLRWVEQNPKRNYVMQWNLNIQREIAPNTAFMIAYVGSRGIHNLFHTDNSAIVLPIEKTAHGYLWPCGPDGSGASCVTGFLPDGTPTAPVNPTFGRVSAVLWSSTSTFHALELQLSRKMSHGLEGQVSYTYGRSEDTSSGSTDGDQFLNGLTSMFYFDPKTRRGPSDFDVPHNFIASYTWDIPGPKNVSGFWGGASTGWELGGIFQVSDGTPFTPIIGGDPLGMSGDAFAIPDRVPGCNPVHGGVNYLNLNCFSLPVATPDIAAQCQPFGFVSTSAPPPATPSAGIAGTCANLFGNAGRNSVIGPRIVNFDMSLVKNTHVTHISETFNVQFRVEAFNIFNHANFSTPTDHNGIFDGSGVLQSAANGGVAGVIDSTATPSRQMQLALKLIW
ncbi:MAG TPA: carboxypeptidase regulatory-like domain-containing protein [Candidatus Acidoferrales bacterium]|nr:carboxypeptidase regulatory-like domain-containing protein [Candidatus Acidoferrales bacterium]